MVDSAAADVFSAAEVRPPSAVTLPIVRSEVSESATRFTASVCATPLMIVTAVLRTAAKPECVTETRYAPSGRPVTAKVPSFRLVTVCDAAPLTLIVAPAKGP
jgi:hypothetical protein